MFESVSGLNKRIEELENAKIILLTKLKGHGDKGGLEYIVKTQNLESVRGKKFDSKIEVEDYQPGKERLERERLDRERVEVERLERAKAEIVA